MFGRPLQFFLHLHWKFHWCLSKGHCETSRAKSWPWTYNCCCAMRKKPPRIASVCLPCRPMYPALWILPIIVTSYRVYLCGLAVANACQCILLTTLKLWVRFRSRSPLSLCHDNFIINVFEAVHPCFFLFFLLCLFSSSFLLCLQI